MMLPWGKRGRGQSFVEFALVLPVLLMTFFVIVELGRLFFTWLVLEQSARAGVRFAVTLEYNPAYCTSGELNGSCVDPAEEEEARLYSIKDMVRRSESVLSFHEDIHWDVPNFLKTTVCVSPRMEGEDHRYLPPDPSIPFDPADCIGGDAPGGPGDFVSVTVDYNYQLVVPVFKSVWPQLRLHVRREARAETFRSNIPVFLPTARISYGYAPTATDDLSVTPTDSGTLPPATTMTAEGGTPTSTPDCSLISISNVFRDDNEVHFIVRNGNEEFPNLIRSVLTWPAHGTGSLFHFTRMYFPYYSFHEYVFLNNNIYTSPVDSGPINLYWPSDARPSTDWAARFQVEDDQPVFGEFAAALTFEYPSWGICQVSGSADFPRITKIPTETPTPGASPTITASITPGGPTETSKVTRTLHATATNTYGIPLTATASSTPRPTYTSSPSATSTADDGPGD